jgi:UDP-N-acetyl-D-mannosaminuronic acid dehydrogenase
VVLTDHSEFREIEPIKFRDRMFKLNIFDTRNIINKVSWKRAGFNIVTIGNI